MNAFSPDDNAVLDRIIVARRSIRQFGQEEPPRDLLERILEAGRLAPFSGIAVAGQTDFRRFFVLPRKSPAIGVLRDLVVARMKELVAVIGPKLAEDASLRVAHARWTDQIERGPRGVGSAPWLVIVAERRGFPASEHQSLACCLENMWLKATALGLAFQVVSHIRNVGGDNAGLCGVLGIAPGEFGLQACSIGYPAKPDQFRVKPRNEPVPDVTWIE